MKPRNWLIGVSHIGMVLVLELWFSARSSSQGSSHSVNGLPLAAALLTVAAGYRVSGFVRWHKGEAFRRRSDSVRYVRYYCRADEATDMPLDDPLQTSQS
jgi:hypothetical protein